MRRGSRAERLRLDTVFLQTIRIQPAGKRVLVFSPHHHWGIVMNKGLIAFVAAAAGLVAAGPSSAEVVEGVTVEAARVVEVGRTVYGAPEQVVVMRRGVNYSDLNLKTAEGQAAMETRIKETATALCKELDKMYPLQDPQKSDCVRDAVRSGMAEVAKLAKK